MSELESARAVAAADPAAWPAVMHVFGEITLWLVDHAPQGYRADTAAWRIAGAMVQVALAIDSPATLRDALADLVRRVMLEDWPSHVLLDSVAELDDVERLEWRQGERQEPS